MAEKSYGPLHEQLLNIIPICFPAHKVSVLLTEKDKGKFS